MMDNHEAAQWFLSGFSTNTWPEEPPGGPPSQAKKYRNGNWFETQLTLSISIGALSFLAFCLARTRWKVLFAPRTLLRGFSPHEVHDSTGFLSWIVPTLRTSELTILQIVGLDAAILLNFFKLGFYYCLTCSIFALIVLVPIHMRENGSTEGVPPEPPDNATSLELASKHLIRPRSVASLDVLPLSPLDLFISGATLYNTSHLVFTYLFTLIAFLFLRRTYRQFTKTRQLFALELAQSVPARTVMVTSLPPQLRNDRALAHFYDQSCELPVESVSAVRDVRDLAPLLEKRTYALTALEQAWYKYVGNPVKVENVNGEYDPKREVERILQGAGEAVGADQVIEVRGFRRTRVLAESGEIESAYPAEGAEEAAAAPLLPAPMLDADADAEQDGANDEEAQLLEPAEPLFTHPRRPRPTFRAKWYSPFSPKRDLLTHLAQRFREADNAVRRRRLGKFRTTDSAFVTFETLAGAQIAAQAVAWPEVGACNAALAPEPRDLMWNNIVLPAWSINIRRLLALIMMLFLLAFWGVPVSLLAQLLSYEAIKGAFPWLAEQIGKSKTVESLVQNSLPSVALITFNALLPFLLEWLCIFQGLKARSWIEYSLLKKYHLFLIINVIFIFVAVSTITLLDDLRSNPGKVIDKLATSLPGARNFFTSYVMIQGLAIMPLQLLQLAVIVPRVFYRWFITRTPRDYAELNAPPVLNLGNVYPQAILVFNICTLYSVISPIILIFGTLYFGTAYLVYKYKLLFVYYRPFESRGQAWPITCNRIGWGLVIFQLFMLGLLSLRAAFFLSSLVIPLIALTVYGLRQLDQGYKAHARYVNLLQAVEVQHGSTGDVAKLRHGHPVTRSQTNLNTHRYEHQDTSVYIVGEDEHTDYAQPPMSDVSFGVLDTGRKRYAHPAIYGQMPEPQLPILRRKFPSGPDLSGGVVLDLRRRWQIAKHVVENRVLRLSDSNGNIGLSTDVSSAPSALPPPDSSPSALSDEEEEQGTYFQHPERRRSLPVPGAWGHSDEDDGGDQ